MNWLARHSERFSLQVQNREFAGKTVEMPWRIKPLGELILLVRVLERHGMEGAALAKLRTAALSYAQDFDWHLLGAFDASAASPLAMVLEFFEAHGVDGTLERDYVSQLSSFGYFEGMDRIPYRSMDVIYSLGTVGFGPGPEAFMKQFTLTSYGKTQLIPRFSFDDMYSLTHAVFYITDFGHDRIEDKLNRGEVARLRVTLARLIAVLLRADNRDILGELLLCWIFCRFPVEGYEQPLIDRAFARIDSLRCSGGAVAPTEEAFADERAEPGQFRKLYHTTLVAAMLYGLWSKER